jgi:hypothetical protein
MPRRSGDRPTNRRNLRAGSQCSQILAHLEAGGVLTTMSAFRLFDCLRLSERIRELRAHGHRIDSTMVRVPSGARVAVYSRL